MPKRPNVLFFFTDDQRFDTIAALGHPVVQTPNIDALVQRGTTFTHAHIPSGTSGAVCMPSRAMLNTGRTLYHLHGAGQRIPEDHVLLGEMFHQNGYRTFGTGKWHNSKPAYARSFSDGDEIFFGGMSDHWNVPAYHFDPAGKYDATIKRCPDPQHTREEKNIGCDHITAGKHSSELFADATINFINDVGDDPFYAYFSFMAPHDPRVMPDRFREMYDPDAIELPPNFSGGHPFPIGCTKVRDEILADFPRDPAEIKTHIAEYYGIISHLDHEVGRVMAALDAAGKTDNTIVVFAGDNGLAVGQHGLMGKQSCYDHSVRVPLIFAGPKIPENVKTDAYVYLLDIYPTLCELIDANVPDSVEGKSMRSAMSNPSEKVRDSLFFGYEDFQRALKDRQYKLIEVYADEQRNSQLFDIVNDPWEMTNLINEPNQQERIQQMRCDLQAWAEDWDDFSSPWGEKFWPNMEFVSK